MAADVFTALLAALDDRKATLYALADRLPEKGARGAKIDNAARRDELSTLRALVETLQRRA